MPQSRMSVGTRSIAHGAIAARRAASGLLTSTDTRALAAVGDLAPRDAEQPQTACTPVVDHLVGVIHPCAAHWRYSDTDAIAGLTALDTAA
jgi:hypothetical protein